MSGFLNNDGSELVGGQLPSGAGQALQLDSGGNLKTTASVTPPSAAISTANSTTTPLAANATFTGTSESALAYGSISVQAYSDHASAASGLIVEQSQDGTNWDTQSAYSVGAATAFQQTVNLTGGFFRIVYTNGAANQTVFRLQVIKEVGISPSAGVSNQRVNAQANDFLTGSIVDLATLLALSGTSSDANTVASFMGRFTKIRDLLSTFAYDNTNELKVSLYGKSTTAGDTPLGLDASGRLTTAIQAVLGTALAADQSNSELRVSVYGTNATGGDTALGINASGNLKTNINGISAGVTFSIKQPTSATGTITSVAGAASDTTLLASNTSRLGAYFYNDSTATLYLAFAGSVSTSSYTVQIAPGGFFEMPIAPIYTGAIHGIWSAANGNCRITEMS